MSLTLFSLNIEADRHLEAVGDYLRTRSPDVVHLQEVYKIHAEAWAREFGYHLVFSPHVDFNVHEHIYKPLGQWGIATLTKIKPSHVQTDYYSEPPIIIPHEFMKVKKHPRSLIIVHLADPSGQSYVFGNTHFTWAMPDVAARDQAPDFTRFQTLLRPHSSIVFSGDFNAPRETMVYRTLSNQYRSWIPDSVDSTLDPELFRKPELKLVVDHLFSTPDYELTNVSVLTGLSDHCGLSATVSKT